MQTTFPLSPARANDFRKEIEEARQVGKFIVRNPGMEGDHTHYPCFNEEWEVVCNFKLCSFRGYFVPDENEEASTLEIAQLPAPGFLVGIKGAVAKTLGVGTTSK